MKHASPLPTRSRASPAMAGGSCSRNSCPARVGTCWGAASGALRLQHDRLLNIRGRSVGEIGRRHVFGLFSKVEKKTSKRKSNLWANTSWVESPRLVGMVFRDGFGYGTLGLHGCRRDGGQNKPRRRGGSTRSSGSAATPPLCPADRVSSTFVAAELSHIVDRPSVADSAPSSSPLPHAQPKLGDPRRPRNAWRLGWTILPEGPRI